MALLYFNQERLLFHPDKLPKDYKFDFDYPFTEVTIPTKNGEQLNALHFSDPKNKGLVVYYHGNAGALTHWGEIAPIYLKAGFDLLIYDYRGFGKSSGTLKRESDLLHDAEDVYAYAKTLRNEKEITVIGYSLGSGLATFIASKNTPKNLILKTPYYSLLKVAQQHTPWLPVKWIFKYPLTTNQYLKNVQCPITIFHGTVDQVIPVEHSRLLTKEKKVDYFEIPGAPHGGMNHNPIFQEFLNGLN